MNRVQLLDALQAIRDTMAENRDFLTDLDARYGDGDLGVSMCSGFQAVCESVENSEQTDLGQLLRGCSNAFNAAAPSTLGTLFSVGMMGMAKSLRGSEEAALPALAAALAGGVRLMMERGGSAPGEKTVIDALLPAAAALEEHADRGAREAFAAAYAAAAGGLERTRDMVGRHGRVAYYGEKTLGDTDAGAAAGMLIFRALSGRFS